MNETEQLKAELERWHNTATLSEKRYRQKCSEVDELKTIIETLKKNQSASICKELEHRLSQEIQKNAVLTECLNSYKEKEFDTVRIAKNKKIAGELRDLDCLPDHYSEIKIFSKA